MPVPSVSDVLSIPTRWGGVTNGADSIASYLAQRQQQGQQLQYQQANQLANAQAMSLAYTGQRNPNIDAMLSQNPYGRFIMPQGSQSQGAGTPQPGNNVMSSALMGNSPASAMFGAGGNVTPIAAGMTGASSNQSQGQSTPSSGSANFSPFNPLASAGPVATSATSEFQPYIGMVPKSITTQNPVGEGIVQSKKTAAEDVSKEGVAQDSAFFQVGNSIRNIVSDLKSAQTQSGGSGRIPGMVGSLAESLGAPDTGNIGSYDAAKTEGAINLARIASGGSRGISSIFQKFEHGFPELSDPDQTQMTKAGTLFRTALSFRRAADSLRQKYSDSQLDAMSPTKLQSLLEQQQEEVSPSDQKQINDYIGGMIKNTQAAPTFSSQGQVATQMNPLSRMLANSPVGKNLGFNNQSQQTNQMPSFNPKTQKLQQSSKTGAYRVVNL